MGKTASRLIALLGPMGKNPGDPRVAERSSSMVIIVHATETRETIAANIGGQDYSYYFVLEKFEKILAGFGTVVNIGHPEQEVEAIYDQCQAKGIPCLFLSFTPPFKTVTGPSCPTICVFAWEYLTIPTEAWNGDIRHDWRSVLGGHGRAITHSSFAVRAVRDAMGPGFPVWSIPAPVWSAYAAIRKKKEKSITRSEGVDLAFQGALIDFRGCGEIRDNQLDRKGFIERRSSGGESIDLHLEGVIYTAVFNPNDGRKNWMDLLWGFCWAFRQEEDATLVMKLVYHDYDAIRPAIINEIEKLGPFKCRVVAIHGFLDDAEYEKLILATSYIVNTSHGEGQCLPLMEFMSSGTPAIAPAHTAMADYIDKTNSFVVKSSLEWFHWPHDPRTALRTMRYRIDWESLYDAYRESFRVARNDKLRYMEMSNFAIERLKNYCADDVVEKRLQEVLTDLVKKKNTLMTRIRKFRLWHTA
jgi:glycosyltransferase involved in cell wall biosynthesis